MRACFLSCALGFFWFPFAAFPQTAPPVAPPLTAVPNGQHDFEFNVGTWKTQITYLQHPLTGSADWGELDGTLVVRNIWNGRAQTEQFKPDRSASRFETLLLRLYNPQARQWSFVFANSGGAILCAHMTGGFRDGRGEFTDREPFNGKLILARTRWSDITRNSHRYEIAFSDDGGKTWEPNVIAALTREKP